MISPSGNEQSTLAWRCVALLGVLNMASTASTQREPKHPLLWIPTTAKCTPKAAAPADSKAWVRESMDGNPQLIDRTV
jgi:hypothetical protein